MFDRCPGQSSRYIKATYHGCQNCGYEVEIFSSELKVTCPACGKPVYRERQPSCIDWCPAAKDCIGYLKWKELKKADSEGSKK
jgi:DNA-directed RNA polymerase subunit RPC12/RpoP